MPAASPLSLHRTSPARYDGHAFPHSTGAIVKTSRTVVACVVLLFTVCGAGMTADEISQIKDLERQTWEVYVKRDLAGLERITAPDFTFYDGESTQNWEFFNDTATTEIYTSYKLGEMNVLRV